jgi:D-sedoheptulose 7-phosphate isomerase
MNKTETLLKQWIDQSLDLKRAFFAENLEKLQTLYRWLREASEKERHVYIFGNGGSAADAQHLAAELMHRVEKKEIGIRAHALHTDTSLLTALGNDEGFDRIYAHQIETLARPSDLAIAISTSGNSTNIVEALKIARARKCRTVGLLGRLGGKAAALCDLPLIVPGASTPRIQEVHGMIIHLVCQLLENQ